MIQTVIFAILGITSLAVMCMLAYWVLAIVGYWVMFEKAGEKGWKSLIPFYSEYTETKIAWQPSIYWWILLFSVATSYLDYLSDKTDGFAAMIVFVLWGISLAASLVLSIKKSYRLALCFGKGKLFAAGLVIFPAIFHMILGFGRSEYHRVSYNV